MKNRRGAWLAALCATYLGIMGAGSCGKKALDQIGEAKQAIEEARAAQAPQYAPDEFSSAEDSLLMAQEQYDRYQYRSSESSALKAETEARYALETALAERARLREEERKRRDEELAYNVSSLYGSTLAGESLEEQARSALHDVHFGFDSSDLSDSARAVLAVNAQWLADHPNIRVELEGHTDERGTDEYNQALGAKRAKSVYNYLVKWGIESSRVGTISYGESVPLDPASNEDAWAKNRRVHFAVMQ